MAQDTSGAMWFLTNDKLTRYRPVRETNAAPAVNVRLDQIYRDLAALPRITAGRLVTFKCSTVDFRTRPERRLYRYAVAPGHLDTPPAKTNLLWQPPVHGAQFEWRTN